MEASRLPPVTESALRACASENPIDVSCDNVSLMLCSVAFAVDFQGFSSSKWWSAYAH
jgi:hypothetical protein